MARHKAFKGGDARLLLRLYPWIFRDQVANAEELRELAAPARAVAVNVENDEGREIGTAVCNLQTGGTTGVNIFARMLADNIHLPIDKAFFLRHIRGALVHRGQFFRGSAHHRLLNAEGDLLPGVVCDRYDDVLCVQFTSAAMELVFSEPVLDALEEALAPSAIVQRRDPLTDRKLDMAPVQAPVLARGAYAAPTLLPEENGLRFEVDLLAEGIDAGRYFEDAPLRAVLARILPPPPEGQDPGVGALRVLSFFGDSLGLYCAAAHGAEAVYRVSESCGMDPARAERVGARSHCAQRVKCSGGLDVSKPESCGADDERAKAFDLVTLEPPALAPTYGQLEKGMQQYTAWVGAAAGAVKPRGLLLVVCRSRAVTQVKFLRCLNLGVWSSGRRAQVLHRSGAAPGDFPLHMALPDSGGLQAALLRLD